MTAETTATAPPSKTRKLIVQLLAGAITGGLACFLVLTALDGARVDLNDPSRLIALMTGLVLAVIGLAVGIGILAPRAGSRILNVEDADELREQRRPLSLGALMMLLGGLGLMTLAVAASGGKNGLVSASTGLVIAALCFGGTIVIAFFSRGASDELMRSLSAEAAVLTLYWLLIAGAMWATLAHLGYVGWITPLGFLASLVALQLIAVFVAIGRRGMMIPR